MRSIFDPFFGTILTTIAKFLSSLFAIDIDKKKYNRFEFKTFKPRNRGGTLIKNRKKTKIHKKRKNSGILEFFHASTN